MKDQPSEIQEINKSVYDELASEYESRSDNLKEVTSYAVSLFIKHLKEKEVLETGCAVGTALNIMEKKGLRVTGIDISPKMIDYAKKRNPKSDLIVGDFLEYKFDKQFDGIFSFAFIHLFPKDVAKQVLQKMHEVLKPGGVMYIGTSKSDIASEGWEEKHDYKKPLKRFRKHWTQDEIENSFTDAGFKILEKYIIEDPYKKVWMDFIVQKSLLQ